MDSKDIIIDKQENISLLSPLLSDSNEIHATLRKRLIVLHLNQSNQINWITTLLRDGKSQGKTKPVTELKNKGVMIFC